MGKLYISPQLDTPGDRVRAMLDKVERTMSNLRGAGPQALKLLYLFDQLDEALAELEANGMDVRAEYTRFETVQRQIRRRRRSFLSEASAALEDERAAVQPDRARWWWFLDEAAAQERQQKLCRVLIGSLAAALILAAAWFAYDSFIAPPPDVRQALEYIAGGEKSAVEGDLQAALAKFEAAAALTPDDSSLWLWQGVIHSELNEPDAAQAAFDAAHSLYETELDLLLDRAIMYLRIGDLAAAGADAEQAILDSPDSGMGYYVRSNIAAGKGDYAAAIADLEQAAELAQKAGDSQLEATARVQLAMIMQQLSASQLSTPSP